MTTRPTDNQNKRNNLIDNINSRIIYYQSVQEDATIQIQKLMNVKSNLIDNINSRTFYYQSIREDVTTQQEGE